MSGTFEGRGDIAFHNRDVYAAMSYVAYGPHGIIAEESDPARQQ